MSGRPCSTGSSSEELRLRLDVFLLDASMSPLDPFLSGVDGCVLGPSA